MQNIYEYSVVHCTVYTEDERGHEIGFVRISIISFIKISLYYSMQAIGCFTHFHINL